MIYHVPEPRRPLWLGLFVFFTSAVYWKIIYWRGSVFLINITKYALDRCINESCQEKARLHNPFTVTAWGFFPHWGWEKKILRIVHCTHILQLSNDVSKCYGKGVLIISFCRPYVLWSDLWEKNDCRCWAEWLSETLDYILFNFVWDNINIWNAWNFNPLDDTSLYFDGRKHCWNFHWFCNTTYGQQFIILASGALSIVADGDILYIQPINKTLSF